MSEEDDDVPWSGQDAQKYGKRARLLWARAREVQSPETRGEFERLALLYERLATREARVERGLQTLGDLLSASSRLGSPEREWVRLVRRAAAQERQAIQTLFLWTHRFVVAFLGAIIKDAAAAEEVLPTVFRDVWQRAVSYDPAADTVIAWIMNHARSRALDRLDEYPQANGETPGPQRPINVAAIEGEPDLTEPAPGLSCKVLATDTDRSRLSMLVRLVPGAEYPPHVHAGVEQLYLLLGELWIDDRKLSAGDYNRAEPGTADARVWSETGCTCILVASSNDVLR